MKNSLAHANVDTPVPGAQWCSLPAADRIALVNQVLRSDSVCAEILAIAEAKPDGQVIIHLLQPLPADRRGTVLLDFEDRLKQAIDPALTVWLEPLGDRNSLRNLRGIEVKS